MLNALKHLYRTVGPHCNEEVEMLQYVQHDSRFFNKLYTI